MSTTMETINITSHATRSLMSGKLSLAQMLPIDFVEDMNTTLNYKYNVVPTLKPQNPPKVRYFGIGIGGRYIADDAALTAAFKSKITDMDLYRPIPFRLVPIDEDLSAAERANYRMRVRMTIRDTEYYAYYLKLIEFTNTISLVRVNPATFEEEPYEIDPSNLTPIGVRPSTSGTTSATLQEIKAVVRAKVQFTGAEVTEAINVLYNGDLRYAVVSELGLYSGEDQLISGSTAVGSTISYLESIYTQLVIKNTWNGSDMSLSGSRESRDIVFTSGTPMVILQNS
jgi:hypothetical protein